MIKIFAFAFLFFSQIASGQDGMAKRFVESGRGPQVSLDALRWVGVDQFDGAGRLLVVDRRLRLQMQADGERQLREEMQRKVWLEPDIKKQILEIAKSKCDLITKQKKLTESQASKLYLAARIQIARDFRLLATYPINAIPIMQQSISNGNQLFRGDSLVVKVLNAMEPAD